MTFLPIVERELRVATRKRSTYWLRVIGASAGLIGAAACYEILMVSVRASGGGGPVGADLFTVLSWLCFVVALSCGIFFTSDCLSEEKRDGTLGLLFLTDLRGYDVVFGKLFATSLRSIFTLLAVFPILAITLMLGGVTATVFWQTTLAVLNAAMLSLSTGILVSALSIKGQRAMARTLILLVIWVFAEPWLENFNAVRKFINGFNVSPLRVLQAADAPRDFIKCLLASQALVWLQLAIAAVVIPRTWQTKSQVKAKARPWWRRGTEKQRRRLRDKWLERDPMLWLALRERGSFSVTLMISISGIVGLVLVTSELTGGSFRALWMFLHYGVNLIVYLAVASQACQFFAEAQRNHLTELLVTTPLTAREIMMGPWRALVRQFAGLVLFLVVVTLFSIATTWSTNGNGMLVDGYWGAMVINQFLSVVVIVTNLAAVAWVGLWMGLVSRNASIATLKTIVFVLVIPWFILNVGASVFIWGILMNVIGNIGGGNSFNVFWYLVFNGLATTILYLTKNYLFWRWARNRLLNRLRQHTTEGMNVVVNRPPSPPAVPPIILKPA